MLWRMCLFQSDRELVARTRRGRCASEPPSQAQQEQCCAALASLFLRDHSSPEPTAICLLYAHLAAQVDPLQ